MSAALPAVLGTIIRMGRVGHAASCAQTVAEKTTASSNPVMDAPHRARRARTTSFQNLRTGDISRF
jgi:hypothetical protein